MIVLWLLIGVFSGIFLIICILQVIAHFGPTWGSSEEERRISLPIDSYYNDKKYFDYKKIIMTRAISINTTSENVWQWIAQIGRGAGFYSYDFLDNGRKKSARHLVSWIPEPKPGDSTAIGYIRELEKNKHISWYMGWENFLSAKFSMSVCYYIKQENDYVRLIMRVYGIGSGKIIKIIAWIVSIIDSIMARKQLLTIKQLAEKSDAEASMPETSEKDQYQLYEFIYASGEKGGVPGKEGGAKWYQQAVQEGIIAG